MNFPISCIISVYATFIFIAFMLNRFFPHWFSAEMCKFHPNLQPVSVYTNIFMSKIHSKSFNREIWNFYVRRILISTSFWRVCAFAAGAMAIILNTHIQPHQYWFLPIKTKNRSPKFRSNVVTARNHSCFNAWGQPKCLFVSGVWTSSAHIE